MKVRFKEWDCIVLVKQYPNKRTALRLLDATDGSPVIMATVNIPAESIENDEVIIKNYSENEGVLDALVEEGIVSKPICELRSGYVPLYVCKLLRTEDPLTEEDLKNECDLNSLESQTPEC